MNDKLKSRKLWLTIILMGIFSFMAWFDKLDSENYIQAMLTLFGIYSGANVLTKFVGGGKNG